MTNRWPHGWRILKPWTVRRCMTLGGTLKKSSNLATRGESMNNYDENDFDDCIDADMEYSRELKAHKEEYDQEVHHPLPCTPTSHLWSYIGGGMLVGIYECTACGKIEIESKGTM